MDTPGVAAAGEKGRRSIWRKETAGLTVAGAANIMAAEMEVLSAIRWAHAGPNRAMNCFSSCSNWGSTNSKMVFWSRAETKMVCTAPEGSYEPLPVTRDDWSRDEALAWMTMAAQ